MGKKFRKFDAAEFYDRTLHHLRNKYYNLFRSNIKVEGLNYRQTEFVMKEFWGKGTVAAFNIKNIDELGFAPYVRASWDMYGCDETVQLVNQFNSPLVPSSIQIVDKDVVLGWIQSNKKPMKLIVDWYLERIAQVESVININLLLHKMPFLIPVEKDEKNKVEDVIDKILNDEIVITVEGVEPALFKAISTAPQYIIDKLVDYKKCLEYDLKTVMGVNNPGEAKAEQLQMAEINSANAEINSYDTDFQTNLDNFSKQISEVLGKTVKFTVVVDRAEYDGQNHTGEQPGPRGDNEDEDY